MSLSHVVAARSARPCGTARAQLPPPGPVRGHARLCAQLTLSKIENYLRVLRLLPLLRFSKCLN